MTTAKNHRSLLLLAALSFAAPLLPNLSFAQENTGVRGGRTAIVDVIVTDRKGAPVLDLNANEMHLAAEGKDVAVQGLQPGSGVASEKQYLVILVDMMASGDQRRVGDALRYFLETNSLANRPTALVYQGNGIARVIQSFTTDAAALRQTVMKSEASGVSGDSRIQNLSTDTYAGGNGAAAMDQTALRSKLRTIENLAKDLGAVEGRKTLVWFTPGFNMGEEDQSIFADVCNRANVSIYPVPVNGTAANASMEPLAKRTGGALITVGNDLGAGLEQVERAQAGRYLITYTPLKDTEDSCHSIRVKVDRGGTTVQARDRYCTVSASDPLAGTQSAAKMEEHAVGAQSGDIVASLQAAHFYTAPNVARVHIAAEVFPATLRFDKQNGKLRATLNVLGVALKADGSMAARFSDKLVFELASKADAEKFRQQLYRYEKQITLASGEYVLKLVFAAQDDSFGKAETAVRITPYHGTTLGISGLALCKEARDAAAALQEAQGALAPNRVPLVSRGIQFIPASTMRFRKTEPATLYFEMYEPTPAEQARLKIRLRILDAKSNETKLDSGDVSAARFAIPNSVIVPVSSNLAVAPLAPGTYRLQVQGANSTQRTEWRTAEFVVE